MPAHFLWSPARKAVPMASPLVPGFELRNRREFQKDRVRLRTISSRPGG